MRFVRSLERSLPQVSGPYVTLSVIGVLEVLRRFVPLPDTAPLVLVLAAVYAGFSGGPLTALFSGALGAAYYGALLANPGEPFHYTAENLSRTIAFGLVSAAAVLMVIALKRRAEHSFEYEAANKVLRQMNHLKSQFINQAAHELRTPLTPIRMQMHLLRGGLDPQLSEQQRRAFTVLDRSFERLTRLVQDIVEAAQAQAGRLVLTPQRVELGFLCTEAVEGLRGPAREKGVDLELSKGPFLAVDADAQRVLQALFRLLDHALDATPAGGRVTLEYALADDHAHALVRVRDTGRGFRAQDIPHLFEPFRDVPGDGDAAGGLGLYVCRSIVEQHGGRLWAESPGPGQGATFAFTLLLADATTRTEPRPAPPVSRTRT